MAKDQAPIPRFPLPDEWEPEGTRCVIVRIPDDAQYLATLTGLLDLLKWSDNFARDDTKTGASIVCRTWQHALELQPITWGDCEQMILRQNPDNPCQLQQTQDGGDTWTLAFDYSLCSQVITVPAPYPGSDTGASDAAAASVRNIFEGLLTVTSDICALTRTEYIDAATNYMRTFDASYANPIALGQIYDEFCALDSDQKTYYQSDCPYVDHKSDLEACANVEGLYDWLNCAAATINNWLNDTSNALMNALNQAASFLTGNGWQTAAGGGAGGGAGFGGSCPAFEWDWAIQTWGFAVIVSGGSPRSNWILGEGWQGQIIGGYTEIRFDRTIASTYVRTVDVHITNDVTPDAFDWNGTGGTIAMSSLGSGWWRVTLNASITYMRFDWAKAGNWISPTATYFDTLRMDYDGSDPIS